jgi:hypothetical protein
MDRIVHRVSSAAGRHGSCFHLAVHLPMEKRACGVV